MALKLRRAEERFIPQSTRAASFKRWLGARPGRSSGWATRSKGYREDEKHNRRRQGGCVNRLSAKRWQKPRDQEQEPHHCEKELGNSGCHASPRPGRLTKRA